MPKAKLPKRIQRRIMQRQLRLIVEAIIVFVSIFILPAIQSLGNLPVRQWQSSVWYYVIAFSVAGTIFALLFYWSESSEKTEVDELEETMDKKFTDLIKHIDELIEEIRRLKG